MPKPNRGKCAEAKHHWDRLRFQMRMAKDNKEKSQVPGYFGPKYLTTEAERLAFRLGRAKDALKHARKADREWDFTRTQCAHRGGYEGDCYAYGEPKFCKRHGEQYKNAKCVRCRSKEVVTYCTETVWGGSMVCGQPLCAQCTHFHY